MTTRQIPNALFETKATARIAVGRAHAVRSASTGSVVSPHAIRSSVDPTTAGAHAVLVLSTTNAMPRASANTSPGAEMTSAAHRTKTALLALKTAAVSAVRSAPLGSVCLRHATAKNAGRMAVGVCVGRAPTTMSVMRMACANSFLGAETGRVIH